MPRYGHDIDVSVLDQSVLVQRLASLTPAQRQTVELICQGLTMAEAATARGVSIEAQHQRITLTRRNLGLGTHPWEQAAYLLGRHNHLELNIVEHPVWPRHHLVDKLIDHDLDKIRMACWGVPQKTAAAIFQTSPSAYAESLRRLKAWLGGSGLTWPGISYILGYHDVLDLWSGDWRIRMYVQSQAPTWLTYPDPGRRHKLVTTPS